MPALYIRVHATSTPSSRRMGYVLTRYRWLSEALTVQKILQIEQRGLDLVVFAIMDPTVPLQNPAVDPVRAAVHHLQRSLPRDGAPNVLLEAMVLSLPVVSTDFSGISEAIVDGGNHPRRF